MHASYNFFLTVDLTDFNIEWGINNRDILTTVEQVK